MEAESVSPGIAWSRSPFPRITTEMLRRSFSLSPSRETCGSRLWSHVMTAGNQFSKTRFVAFGLYSSSPYPHRGVHSRPFWRKRGRYVCSESQQELDALLWCPSWCCGRLPDAVWPRTMGRTLRNDDHMCRNAFSLWEGVVTKVLARTKDRIL